MADKAGIAMRQSSVVFLNIAAETLAKNMLDCVRVLLAHRKAKRITLKDFEALDLVTVNRYNDVPRKRFLERSPAEGSEASNAAGSLPLAHVKLLFKDLDYKGDLSAIKHLSSRWHALITDLVQWSIKSAQAQSHPEVMPSDVLNAVQEEALKYTGYARA